MIKKILRKNKKLLTASIIGLSVATIVAAQPALACGYYHPCRRAVGPGLFIGAAFGLIAGAAIASANQPTYYYNSCRRVVIRCNGHYGPYGRYYRRCFRRVRYVC